ncbi:hypothetical protein Emag_004797 [Eimeria magna]
MEEGPSEILERYAVGPRAPVPRPAAASRISLVLLSAIGAAVAFLLATCFRRLRSRGPAKGLRVRSLAGLQRWGAAVEEGGEEQAFLSQALEGCLDLEVELGFAAPAPQPFPLPENEAVKSIVFSLKEAAMMFETRQASDGFLETSLSSTPQEAPQLLDLTAQADDQSTRQRTEAWQETGSPQGAPPAPVPTPPMPPQGALHNTSDAPELLSLLQQRRRSKSSEAAAAAEEEEAASPPPKKPRRNKGGATSYDTLYALFNSTLQQAGQQEQDSSSGSGGDSPGEKSPSLSAGSPQASTTRQSPEVSADTGESLMQPSSLEVVDGSISVVLETGEKITFPHPPIPTPPDTPLHYRLPLVQPGAVKTQLLIHAAFPIYSAGRIWSLLDEIRVRLRKPVLTTADVTHLMAVCQHVLKYLLTKQTAVLKSVVGSRAVERLSMRYLCLEALVNCIQLIGPAMKPEEWFPQLVSKIHADFVPTWLRGTPETNFNNHLATILTRALTELKAGRRPSLELTEEIKRMLFPKKSAPALFRPRHWDSWRSDFEEDEDSDPSDIE